MKPWIKRTLVGIVGVSLLAGGIAAFGHRHHGGWHGPMSAEQTAEQVAQWRGRLLDRAGSELALDDAQRVRLGDLFDALDAQRQALVGDTPDPRAEMRALIAGPTFDRAKAQSLLTEKTDAVRMAGPAVIAAAGDFFDGLNPDQQARVRALMDRRHRHGGWSDHDRDREGDRQ